MSEIRVDSITDEAGTGRPAFTNGVQTSNINGGQIGGRRNVLINGDFQVSQRGDFTSPTAINNGDYGLDRWLNSLTVDSATFEDKGKNLRIEISSGGTGQVSARQKIELGSVEHLFNQKVTLSAKIKSNTTNARLILYANGSFLPVISGNDSHSGGGTEEFLSATFDFPSSTGGSVQAIVGIDGPLSANVSLSAGDYIEIREVQLEVGDTATEFEHRSYSEELALCQRYFENVVIGNDGMTFSINKFGSCSHNRIYFKTTKRVLPSVSSPVDQLTSFGVYNVNTDSTTVNMEFTSETTDMAAISIERDDLTLSEAVAWVYNNIYDFPISLSADAEL